MTSDKAKIQPTTARMELDIALGKRRVDLSALSDEELSSFLHEWLDKVDLRELRGFKSLHRSLEGGRLTFPLSSREFNMNFAEGVSIDGASPDSDHFLDLSRWDAVFYDNRYRKFETGEETEDHDLGEQWVLTRQGFVQKTARRYLLLRRPRGHDYGSRCLYELSYIAEKVPEERRYLIARASVKNITPEMFREHFGMNASQILQVLLSELCGAHSRTVTALEEKISFMRKGLGEWERLASVVSR